jgi:long-chain acyl-CoA synthetase
MPAPDTFPRLLIEHARQRGDHPAIREKDLGIWQTYSWKQALEEVRSLACGLHALGRGRGDTLAIVGDNRPRLYWAMDAAQALGAIPVPLYQDAVAEEMAYVLTNADVRIAIVEDQEQVGKLLEVKGRCPRASAGWPEERRVGPWRWRIRASGGTRRSASAR